MFEWVVTSSVFILIMIAVRQIFIGRISPRLQYSLWFFVMLRLLCPVMIADSSFSILNVAEYLRQDVAEKEITEATDNDIADEETDIWNSENLQTADPGNPADSAVIKTEAAEDPDAVSLQASGADGAGKKAEQIGRILLLGGMIVLSLGIVLTNIQFRIRLRRARKLRFTEGRLPVYTVSQLKTPCLFGILRPAIYLPEQLWEQEDEKEMLRFALVHERNHYRHGDHIWALLRCVCLIIHWYNPLVWAAVALSRRDGELACDESTVRELGEEYRYAYGKALISWTVGTSSTGDFLCCATSLSTGKKSIKERITLLAGKPRVWAISVVIVGLIVVAAVGISFTGRKPGADAGEERRELPQVHYELIESTTVENEFFSMTVAKELVGEVGYQITYEYDEYNRLSIAVTFVMDRLALTETVEEQSGDTKEAVRVLGDSSAGILSRVGWRGLCEMENGDDPYGNGSMECLLLYAGEVDFAKMDALYRYVYGFGPEGEPIDFNSDRTGAYCLYHPTDVQFPMEEAQAYARYEELLREAFSTFQAKEYPYDTVDIVKYEILLDYLRAEEAASWFGNYYRPDALTEEFVANFYYYCEPYVSLEQEAWYREKGSGDGVQAEAQIWSEDGKMVYAPMRLYGITSMTELESYMNRYLPPEMTEQLLQEPRADGYMPFIEQNDVLYRIKGGMGLWHYLGASRKYEITLSEDGRHADLRLYETLQQEDDTGGMEFSYSMELGEDGSWHVTEPFEPAIETLVQ